MDKRVEYRVGLSSRAQHLFEVEARFPLEEQTVPRVSVSDEPRYVDLKLPVWTPGSYLIREYPRHLQDVFARDPAVPTGGDLRVRKIDKCTFRVEVGAARELVVRYRVYAHEVTVRTSHLDGSHAFFNGATLFFYLDALRDVPARVEIDAPEGWHIATALDAQPGSKRTFLAPDYDTLVDSPFEIGPHERIDFTAAGKPAAVAVWGRATFDRKRLVDDFTAIMEAQAKLFGGVPYDRYTFILHLVSRGYGGLEHKSSATLLASPFAFAQEKKYQELLELASHEFFHLWNGKRIRPRALGPFDYQNEAHTRSLWVVEGWTSYYDRLMLRRADRLPAARFLEKLGDDLGKLARTPGRFRQSLEESSWDAWIKLYRPDENLVNTTVSYYLKGSVVALLLDLEIRMRSRGERTLDDALRRLWRDQLDHGRGYPDEALQPLVEEATGVALDDFFAHAVRGRGELALEGPLSSVGLRAVMSTSGQDDDDTDGAEVAWLGANLGQTGERLRVTEAIEEGPAQLCHLYAGDEIVALDGFRVDESALKERLGTRRPGDRVRLTLFRRDELTEVEVTLASRPKDKVEIVPIEGASDEQKRAYREWMLTDWVAGS